VLLLVAGVAALYFFLEQSKKQQQQHVQAIAPAAAAAPEVRALQDSVRMLMEAQQRQALMQQAFSVPQQQPPAWSEYGQQQAQASHASMQPQFQRRSAAPQQPDVPTTPAVQGSVSTEVFSEMKKMQDDIKNLERKNRELNRQLTLTEVSNVVDLEKKYRLSEQRACTRGLSMASACAH